MSKSVSIITDLKEHYAKVVENLLDHPRAVDVMAYTFGAHTIKFDPSCGQSTVQLEVPCFALQAMMILQNKRANRCISQARVLLGHPPSDQEALAKMDKIEWRVHPRLHAKAWIFYFEKKTVALVGSRNLSSSNWAEITVYLQGKGLVQPVSSLFGALWKQGTELSSGEDWFNQAQEILETGEM